MRICGARSTDEYFYHLLEEEQTAQDICLPHDVISYLINRLSQFVAIHKNEWLWRAYHGTLTGTFAQAHYSAGRERFCSFQALGDTALFLAGFFPHSRMDFQYVVQMGRTGYYNCAPLSPHPSVLATFELLAKEFVLIVGILNSMSSKMSMSDQTDIMRLYEQWTQTRSVYAARALRELGVHVVPFSTNAN